MTIEELVQRIQLPKEAYKQAMMYPFTKEMKKQGQLLCHDETAFITYCKQRKQHRLFSLRLLLELAVDVKDTYDLQGIDEKVYDDTFLDISLWCQNCYKHYHEWGIDEVIWLRFHICMEVFRLGRLAFQKIQLPHDIEAFKKYQGDEVIEVHVAQGEPLLYEECIASFHAALDFYQVDAAWFWGESWLLHPALQTMLPKTSNIIRFSQLFQVYDIDETSHQGEERIFGCVKNPQAYPQDTTLQKQVRQYLLQGHTLGLAKGIVYLKR